jgi:hypothetical protein
MFHRLSRIVLAAGATVAVIAAMAGPASARASAGIAARQTTSAGLVRAADATPIRNPGKLPVPVVLTYTATTSDSDTCTGYCAEPGYQGMIINFTSYTESASATLSANFGLTENDEGDGLTGTGPLAETNATFQSSGKINTGDPNCPTATKVVMQGTTPGTGSAGLSPTGEAGTPDLDLSWGNASGPFENVLQTQNPTCGTPSSTPTTTEEAEDDISAVDQKLGLDDITGWTIKLGWSAQTGETYATNTVTGSAPWPTADPPQADDGMMNATQTWTIGCPTASTMGERIACVAELAVYGLPLPGWDGGRIPYLHGGGHATVPGPTTGEDGVLDPTSGGLDCSGFTRWIYYLVYGTDVLGAGTVNDQRTHKGVKEVATTPSVGDLVFYESAAGAWYHAALLIKKSPDWQAGETHTGDYANFCKVTCNATANFYTYTGP